MGRLIYEGEDITHKISKKLAGTMTRTDDTFSRHVPPTLIPLPGLTLGAIDHPGAQTDNHGAILEA